MPPAPAIMPHFLDANVPNALEKSGFITAPSVTTAASPTKVYNFVSLYNLTQSQTIAMSTFQSTICTTNIILDQTIAMS